MDEDQIEAWLTSNLDGVQRLDNLGMRFLFVGSERMMPFVTFVSDDHYDAWSGLDRPGAVRLNLGVRGPPFRDLFPDSKVTWYWSTLDSPIPHPASARQHW